MGFASFCHVWNERQESASTEPILKFLEYHSSLLKFSGTPLLFSS